MTNTSGQSLKEGTVLYHPTLSRDEIIFLADVARKTYENNISIDGWEVITPDFKNYGLTDDVIIDNTYFLDSSEVEKELSIIIERDTNIPDLPSIPPGVRVNPFLNTALTAYNLGVTVVNKFDVPDASAIVARRSLYSGQQELLISFRGIQVEELFNFLSDDESAATELVNTDKYFVLYKPLFDALSEYIRNTDVPITRILLTGHNIGGATVERFVDVVNDSNSNFNQNFPSLGVIKENNIQIAGITLGSPIAPFKGESGIKTNILNIGNENDIFYSFFLRSSNTNTTDNIYIRTSDNRLNGEDYEPDNNVDTYNLVIERIFSSKYYDLMMRDQSQHLIFIDNTDSRLDNTLFAKSLFILGENDQNDYLFGGNENDVIEGFGGNDTLVGGKGNDILDGGEDSDLVDYSEKNEKLIIDIHEPSILVKNVRFRDDELSGPTIFEDEEDTLVNVENIIGSDKDDTFNIQTLNLNIESLDGYDGNEDSLSAISIETENYQYLNEEDFIITIDLKNETFSTSQISFLIKNFEKFEGTKGNDLFLGNITGKETLDGGDGIDQADYSTVTDRQVFIEIEDDKISVNPGGFNNEDTLLNIEKIIGSKSNDEFNIKTENEILYLLDGSDGDEDLLNLDDINNGVSLNVEQGKFTINNETNLIFEIANFEVFEGTNADDDFVVNSTTKKVDGGDGLDSIDFPNLSNINNNRGLTITNTSVTGNFNFSFIEIENIEFFNGTNLDDLFDIVTFQDTYTFNGEGGTDTINYSSVNEELVFNIQKNLVSVTDPGLFKDKTNILGFIENIIGSRKNDIFKIENDIFKIEEGNENIQLLDGDRGTDTIVFSDNFANYDCTENSDGSFTFSHTGGNRSDGTIKIVNFESFEFKDRTFSIESLLDEKAQPEGGTIRGTKWDDLNGNGSRNNNEPGLSGVEIYLDINNNGILDSNEPVTLTDQSGNYQFIGLLPDTYIVREVIPEGFRQTFPLGSETTIGDGFADIVLEFFDSGTGDLIGTHGGVAPDFNTPVFPEPISTNVVLGDDTNEVDFLVLPEGSYITVGFTDETVIDQPGDDIFITEFTPRDEQAEVFVSSDSTNFELLGIANGGTTTAFDLADIDFNQQVQAIKVLALNQGTGTPGFELANVRVLENIITSPGFHTVDLSAGEVVENIDFGNSLDDISEPPLNDPIGNDNIRFIQVDDFRPINNPFAPQPANFTGSEIQLEYLFPDLNTRVGNATTATVGNGIEFGLASSDPDSTDGRFDPGYNIDITGNSIIFETVDSPLSNPYYLEADFNGIVFTDIVDTLPAIENVTIDTSVTNFGINNSDITFTEDSIEINFAGISYTPGEIFKLDVTF